MQYNKAHFILITLLLLSVIHGQSQSKNNSQIYDLILQDKFENSNIDSIYEAFVTIKQTDDTNNHLKAVDKLSRALLKNRKNEAAVNLNKETLLLIKSISTTHDSIRGKAIKLSAYVHQYLGEYDKAIELYKESISILENTTAYKDLYFSMGNLADTYVDVGNLKEAEVLYTRALEGTIKNIGVDSERYRTICQGLAMFYLEIGNHAKALTIQLDLYKNFQDNGLTNDITFAYNTSNLGLIYKELGDNDNAEIYLVKGYQLLKEIVGGNDRELLLDLTNLGNFYGTLGKFDKASEYYYKTIEVFEANEDSTSLNYGYTLICKGFNHVRSGQCQEALLDSKKAEKVFSNLFSGFSRWNRDVKYLHAKTQICMGNQALAEQYFAEYLYYSIEYFKYNSTVLTLEELKHFEKQLEFKLSYIMSHVYKKKTYSSNLTDRLFEIILTQKGFSLEQSIGIANLTRRDDSKVAVVNQWKAEKAKYIKEIEKKTNSSTTIDSLDNIVADLEKRVYLHFGKNHQSATELTYENVKSALPKDAIAIEFGMFDKRDLVLQDSIPEEFITQEWYYAYVIDPLESHARIIPLFDAKELSEKIKAGGNRKQQFVNQLYSIDTRGAKLEGPENKSLYSLIIEPISPYIQGKSTIYFAPEGLLHRINLGAISINRDETVSDQYNLVQLGSCRNILSVNQDASPIKTALLVGDLTYLAETSDSRNGEWNQLPYTLDEVENINTIFTSKKVNTTTLLQENGSEENILKQIEEIKPSCIHIASHGFFNEKEVSSEEPDSNPLTRSGIVLSNTKSTKDNILTALEVSELNLESTELVVLSACETGLGDIEVNHGVFGLQRALKIAGVNKIIMSLWKVPDRQTKDFMTSFYSNLMKTEDSNIRLAFQQTQREMKARFYDPYLWAGFVLLE